MGYIIIILINKCPAEFLFCFASTSSSMQYLLYVKMINSIAWSSPTMAHYNTRTLQTASNITCNAKHNTQSISDSYEKNAQNGNMAST